MSDSNTGRQDSNEVRRGTRPSEMDLNESGEKRPNSRPVETGERGSSEPSKIDLDPTSDKGE